MKRKTFLETSIVAGLGFSLMPQLVFASKNKSMQVFDLPFGTEQIRHGNLYAALNQPSFKAGFRWLLNFEKHIFLKNGFTIGDEDLQHFSIKLQGQNEPVNFAVAGNKVLHFQSNDVKIKALPGNQPTGIFHEGNYSVKIGSCAANLSIMSESIGGETIIINLASGNISLNDKVIQKNQGIFCSGYSPLSIKLLSGNPVFILIEKKD